MKIAIISDIHGNIEALEAVLNDLKSENCSKIFCLGDIAMAGPEPDKAISLIKNLLNSSDFTIIQGNTDFMISQNSPEIHSKLLAVNQVMANAYLADCDLITLEDKRFLASLPKQKEITINNLQILLVHGSPRKQDENIFPEMKIQDVEDIISSTNANIIFCGHTHMPCGYQTSTKQTVVNVGSVGRPFSEFPLACYAILEIEDDSSFEIKHKLVKYDFQTAADKLAKRKFIGADKLSAMLVKAT